MTGAGLIVIQNVGRMKPVLCQTAHQILPEATIYIA